jgi:hypothetical protein
MGYGNRLSTATHEAYKRHELMLRDLPVHEKVMYRMDRRLRERNVRSYRGWSVWGKYFAKLNFHNGFIVIDLFGRLYWREYEQSLQL